MKFYKVGGAVRDELLGREPKDIDYVVVGATEQEMLDLGYKKVGADFPVFLKDHTEYAMARTERKVGVGYNGFVTDFNPSVTLEEDLRRRDLTINAMARDLETNELIDPFGGESDLKKGILRHVSEAFAEDPLRVLRVARFQARYSFDIAPETEQLMIKLVNADEMEALTAERVWLELEKGLMEVHPDFFVYSLVNCGAWSRLFPELPIFYLTKDYLHKAATKNFTFEQRMMLLMLASRDENFEPFFNRVKAPQHIHDLSKILRDVVEFLAYHDKSWSEEAFSNMYKKTDAIRRPQRFNILDDVIKLLCYHNSDKFDLWTAFREALNQSLKVNISMFDAEGLTGREIGEAIAAIRKQKIKEVCDTHYIDYIAK